jgi:hypothetical protein
MRLCLERRRAPPPDVRAVEVVTPRTNAATITAAQHFFAGMTLAEPFGVEVAGDQSARRFVCRTGSRAVEQQLRGQLTTAYPQAEARPLAEPADPARAEPGERVLACTLELRAAPYLPIRIFDDVELDAGRATQADPVLGILSALGDLPEGWRALSQLVLHPAPEDWCRDFLRLTVQHPLVAEQTPRHADTSLTGLLLLVGVLLGTLLGYQAYAWFVANQWLPLAGSLAALGLGGLAAPWVIRRFLGRPVYDMALVRDKLSSSAFEAQLRLAVIAPAAANPAELQARLDRLVAAYRPYNVAAGNGFLARGLSLRKRPGDLRLPWRLGGARARALLSTRELAGLWHLPHASADVPLLERTTARRFMPLPPEVADGCRIGTSEQYGQEVPVSVPDDLTRRHLLLVAKTRRGKSTLMLRLAAYTMRQQRTVVLVDPHRDLAQAALGVVPAWREGDVVALDVGNTERPFGLNLLDVGLGWDRDRAVANALTIFRREWDRFWGPRMEDAFRFALLTLFEANEAMCSADPLGGRTAQHTILDVPDLMCEPAFRRSVLGQVADPAIRAWWTGYYDQLDRRLQLEVVNPVLTKVHRFEGSRAARQIVGQPRSTVDPGAWVRDGAIVVVNTARGRVGEDTAGLVGGTLLNLVALAVSEQVALDPAQRRSISLLVDEFHTLPGADYESILAELSKYGANLVLATQSLARLALLDRERERGLQASVFANLDGLFAFNCSAEDARYLVPELGGPLDEQDLVELGEHQCYARLSSGGRRLPTFSVRLDPPLASDAAQAGRLIAASAERYGRDAALVEADRRSALARVQLARKPAVAASAQASAGSAPASPAPAQPVAPARNQHRKPKRRRAGSPPETPETPEIEEVS